MKRKVMISLLFFLAVTILSGCATKEGKMRISYLGQDKTEEFIPRKNAVLMLGFIETEAIRNGKVTIIIGVGSERMIGQDFFPLRIMWDGIAVTPEHKFFRVQSQHAGMMKVKKGKEHAYYPLTINLIEGLPDETRDARVINISTSGNFAYTLGSWEIPLSKYDFQGNPDIGYSIALENGSRVGDMGQFPEYLEVIKNFNKYQVGNQILLTPATEEQVKWVAGLNNKDTYIKKLIATGNFNVPVPTSLYTMAGFAIGLAWDMLRATWVPSESWGDDAFISRRNMGLFADYMNAMRNKAIENFNNPEKVIDMTRR